MRVYDIRCENNNIRWIISPQHIKKVKTGADAIISRSAPVNLSFLQGIYALNYVLIDSDR